MSRSVQVEWDAADGERLKALISAAGLSQRSLAVRLGVSLSAVSNWVTANSAPTAPSLRGLADSLDCTADRLLGREGAAATPNANGRDLEAERIANTLARIAPELQNRVPDLMDLLTVAQERARRVNEAL